MRQIFGARRFLFVIASLGMLALPGSLQAQTCQSKPTLDARIKTANPNLDGLTSFAFDTGANVIASFNNARRQEGCNVPSSIDPAAYDAAPPDQQILLLVNAERRDRGLPPITQDTTLMSPIALNHAREMSQYNYYSFNCLGCVHSSAINRPGGYVWDRLYANPSLNNIGGTAENISPGHTLSNVPGENSAGLAVYSFLYNDSDPNWGHRQAILGYNSYIDNQPGHYNWIGIGVAPTASPYDVIYVLDFLNASSRLYTTPGIADTEPPSMSPPTIVDENTVQVTNVWDDSDTRTDGVAGVTGVVFYVGSIGYTNGNFTTVLARQITYGTWQAKIPVTDVTTLHAVAVDGSGNFSDCAGNGSGCSTTASLGCPPNMVLQKGPDFSFCVSKDLLNMPPPPRLPFPAQ